MIMNVLAAAGQDFDYLVGARLEGFPQSVNITHAPVIVCEGMNTRPVRLKKDLNPFSFSTYRRDHRDCLGSYQCLSHL